MSRPAKPQNYEKSVQEQDYMLGRGSSRAVKLSDVIAIICGSTLGVSEREASVLQNLVSEFQPWQEVSLAEALMVLTSKSLEATSSILLSVSQRSYGFH